MRRQNESNPRPRGPGLRTHQTSCSSREGIGLFEVVLAIAIFFGASLAMTQILRTGSRAAVEAHLTSKAEVIAESQMNQVLAGIQPLTAVSRTAIPEYPDWLWTLTVTSTDVPYLMKLEVTIELEKPAFGTPIKFTLVRYLRDPLIFTLNVKEEGELP